MSPPEFDERQRGDRKRWLADEFRRQGQAELPPFSAALHGRIWEAIVREPCGRGESDLRERRSRLAQKWLGAAAAVAACAAGLAVALWHRAGGPVAPGPVPVAQPHPVPPPLPEPLELPRLAIIAPDVGKLPAWVDLAASPRWAWLDHDARLTVETLAGQLPRDLATVWSQHGAEKTP